MNWIHPIFSFLAISLLHPVLSDEVNHIYEDGEEVLLWMGTARPYDNKQQTYSYYSLPFCKGPKDHVGHYEKTLTETLQGIEYDFSGLDIQFKVSTPKTAYCATYLTEERVESFKYALYNEFWYEMSLDKLPIWGVIGEVRGPAANTDGPTCYLFTHKKIDIKYNGNQIVGVSAVHDMTRVKLTPNITAIFTYEVNWIESQDTFEDRFHKYLNPSFFFDRVYWLSLLYSFMKVIVALSLVYIIILRILRKRSYLSSNNLTENTADVPTNDQDIFKLPRYPMLFSTLIGNGIQIVCGSLALIIYGTANEFQTERGPMLTAAIFIYVLTCPINGFCGGGLYATMGGKLWMSQLLLSAFIGPLLIWGVTLIISFIASWYGITRAMSLEAVILWTLLVLFLPLFTSIGTVLAKNRVGTVVNVDTDNARTEPSTEKKWFLHPLILIPCSGIFPFGTIFMSLRFIFDSFWEYQIYLGFDFMFLSFVFLFIMILCTSVVCTHLLFKGGRYNWQWTSFLGGAFISVYVYIYSIHYFLAITQMYGIFQTIYYFAYMTLFSLTFGVMGGAVAYCGASEFVRKIYSPTNGRKRQQNILQYVLSEKSNNSIWLVPDQSLEKPADDVQKDLQDSTDLPQLHSTGNLETKNNVQVKV